MKIGFFGTPEIAARCLEYLCDIHEILFLITQEDKPAGRHRHLAAPAAKETAIRRGITVLQPKTLKDGELVRRVSEFRADVFVVVAYGRIIPRDIFDLPPLKTVNLHPSLLPLYRGAAPVEWAIVNGETETGVTVQLINEQLDAGDIVLQEKITVAADMNAADLYREAIAAGAPLLDRAIRLLEGGETVPVKQDEARATYCKKIDHDTGRIGWSSPASSVNNLVRGLNPKPVAWTNFRSKPVRIWKTALPGDTGGMNLAPGEVARFQKKRLLAGTGSGIIELLNLQPENRDVMDAAAFINGYRLSEGDSFS